MGNQRPPTRNRTHLSGAGLLALLLCAIAGLLFPGATPAAAQGATTSVVSFDSPAQQTGENSGSTIITLNIEPPLTSASTVSLQALNGDPNHTADDALFSFPASVPLPANQSTVRVAITINDNDVVAGQDSVTIALGLFPTNDAPYTLKGTAKKHLLQVQDDDTAQLSFVQNAYTVAEGGLLGIAISVDKELGYDIRVWFEFGPDSDDSTTNASAADYIVSNLTYVTLRSESRTSDSFPLFLQALSDSDADGGEVVAVKMTGVDTFFGQTREDESGRVSISETPAVITIQEPRNPQTAPGLLRVDPGHRSLLFNWYPTPDTVDDYDIHYTSASADDVADDASASGTDASSAWRDVGFALSENRRTFHQLSGLTNGTEYRTRIRAVRTITTTTNGETTTTTVRGPWGHFDPATPLSQPPAPTGLSAVPDNGHARLSWNAVAGAEAYHLGIRYPGEDDYARRTSVRPPAGAGPVIHYDKHSLTNGREHLIRIRSCSRRLANPYSSDSGCGPWSANSVSVTPMGLDFNTPEPGDGKIEVHRGPGRLYVTWPMVTTGVEIHYTSYPDAPANGPATAFDPAFGWVDTHYTPTAPVLNHTIAGLHGNVAYRVRVRLVGDGAPGPWLFGEGTPTTVSQLWIPKSHNKRTVREHFGGYKDEIHVPVRLYPALEEDTAVNIEVVPGGSAKRWHDFTILPPVLVFPAGATTANLTIRGPGRDEEKDGDKTAIIYLAPKGLAPYTIDHEVDNYVKLTVKDNSLPQTGGEPQFRLSATEMTITEGESFSYGIRFRSQPDSKVVVHSRVAYDDSNGRKRHEFIWHDQSVDTGAGQNKFVLQTRDDDVAQGDIVYYIFHHLVSEDDEFSSNAQFHSRDEEAASTLALTVVDDESRQQQSPVYRDPVLKAPLADIDNLPIGESRQISLARVFGYDGGGALSFFAGSSSNAVATVSAALDGNTLTVTGHSTGTATIRVAAEDPDGDRATDQFDVTVVEEVQQQQQDGEQDYAALIAKMYEWRNDPARVNNAGHTDLWDRALLAFGETVADAELTPMTADKAQTLADRGWQRWVKVAKALKEIEQAAAQQQQQQQQAAANNAPTVASAIADATIVNASGTKDVSLSGVFADADGDSLTITAASSDTAKATVSVSADHSTLTVTAAARGTATVTVTANDGNGGTVEDTFTVTVKAAPVVASALADLTLVEGAPWSHDLSTVFSDADGDALTYSVSSSDTDVATVFLLQSQLSLFAMAEGTATITLTAEDADGNEVTDEFDVAVEKQYAALIAKMWEWRNDPARANNAGHTDLWDRALLAFGETVEDSSLTAMKAAEAQTYADRGWQRWVKVAKALKEIEDG